MQTSSYAGKFASKNEQAAKDWAAERAAKLKRASELREARKSNGVMDPECTFTPQKFSNYQPRQGSAKQGNGLSEYSQEYLRNFHFQAREEEEFSDHSIRPGYADQQQPQQQNVRSNSFSGAPENAALNSQGSYSRSSNVVTSAGQKILSSGNYYNQGQQISNRSDHEPETDLYRYAPAHHHHQQQQQMQHAYKSQGYANQGYHSQHSFHHQQHPHYAPSPQQHSYHESYMNDALSNEVLRHSQADDDTNDQCNMSYEFAASVASRSKKPSVQASYASPQRNVSGPSAIPFHDPYSANQVHQQQPLYSQHTNSTLGGSRGMPSQTNAYDVTSAQQQQREEEGEGRGERRGVISAPGTGKGVSSTPPQQRTVSARPRLDHNHVEPSPQPQRQQVTKQTMACTRQSGCGCSQCNADGIFQNNLRGGGGAADAEANVPRRSKRNSALDSRPPWNGDVDTVTAESSEQAHAQPAKRNSLQDRPPWNDITEEPTHIIEDNDLPAAPLRQQKPKRSAVVATKQRPQWNGGDDIVETKEIPTSMNRTDNMRRELNGGKSDFIDQVESKQGSKGYGGPRNSKPASHNPRPQQPQQQPVYSRPSSGSGSAVSAPYRGMFVPEQNSQYDQNHQIQQQQQQQRQQPQNRRQAQDAKVAPSMQERGSSYEESSHQDNPINRGSGDGMGIPEYGPTGQLHECSSCGRKFNENAIDKHTRVCQKVFQTKRKAFNSAEVRLQDVLQNPDDARVVKDALRQAKAKPGAAAAPSKASASAKKEKWKQQSLALREAMKANRMIAQAEAAGVDIKTLNIPVASTNDDYVNCPNCGRNFNEKAAERHIPKCKDMKAKPSRLVRGGGTNSSMRVQPKRNK